MRKRITILSLGFLNLWLLCGTLAGAWSDTRPWLMSAKNLRFRYALSNGTVVQDIDFDLYYFSYGVSERIQQKSFVADNGTEYDITGYRLELFRNRDYTELMNEDTSCKSTEEAWDRINDQFASDEPPLSMILTCVLSPTGAVYTSENLVRVILLDQNSNQFAELPGGTIRNGEYFYADPPKEYEIISAKAFMMTIWNTSQQVDFSEAYPVIFFSNKASEYTVMYRVLVDESSKESSAAESSVGEEPAEEGPAGESSEAETEKASGEAVIPEGTSGESTAAPESALPSGAYRRETDAEGREILVFTPGSTTESSTVPAERETQNTRGGFSEKPDESFHSTNKLLLIGLGAVLSLGILVAVLAAGERQRKTKKRL